MALYEGAFGPAELDAIGKGYHRALKRVEESPEAHALDREGLERLVADTVLGLAREGEVSPDRLALGALRRLGYCVAS